MPEARLSDVVARVGVRAHVDNRNDDPRIVGPCVNYERQPYLDFLFKRMAASKTRPSRQFPRHTAQRDVDQHEQPFAEPGAARWLIERDPSIATLFAKLDAGWRLPKSGEFTVDPSNAPAEARIIRHLLRERLEQCAGRPAQQLAVDAAGPIVAPAPNAPTAERATGCCRNKDERDVPAGSKHCGNESREA